MNDNRYVEIANLTKAYPNPFGQDVAVVKDFNLILRKGEVVSVIGHSGCGKSTVLTMLAGLNPISSGSLVVDGREVSGPGLGRFIFLSLRLTQRGKKAIFGGRLLIFKY